MKYLRLALVVLTTLFVYVPNVYSGLSGAPVISKNGEWSVRKNTDPMTDKTSCVALYQNRFDIQVNEDKLYLDMKGKGGLKSFKYRIGDQKASKMQIPDKTDKSLSLLKISNFSYPPFKYLLTANRLRIQVFTLTRDVVNEDINLNGLSEVYKVLIGPQCQ